MDRHRRVLTHSPQETIAFGGELATLLQPNAVLAFFGDLGAGKTTLIKGIVHAKTGVSQTHVVSPTFVYLNVYDQVYHFDLYRLHSCEEFLSLGFEHYFFLGGICCIEWSERIASILPKETIRITVSHVTEASRHITVLAS